MRMIIVAAVSMVLLMFGCATTPQDPAVSEAAEPAEEQSLIEQIPEEEDVYSAISAAMIVGNVGEAISAFEDAYSKDPEDEETRILYSNLLLAAGQIEEARMVLEEVLAGQPDNTDALYNLALIEGITGREDEQERILLEIVDLDPDYARAHASLGELRLKAGVLVPARESFEKSLAIDPDSVVGLMGYGNVLLRTAEPEMAEEQFTKVIDQIPDYVFAFVDRSRTRMETGDYKGAEADLSTAIERDPEYYWHYIDRGRVRLLGLNSPEAALDDFNRAVEIDQDYFYAYVYRGGLLDQFGSREQAIDDYLKVLDSRHDYFYIYEPLGVLLYMEQRWTEAAVYFQKAYDFAKGEHFYAFLIALSLKKDGQHAGAKRYMLDAAGRFDRDSLYYRLARIFSDPGSDGFVTGEVSKEEIQAFKLQGLFVLATHYLITGQPVLAQKFLLEVEENARTGSPERRLSIRELEQFRSKGSSE